MKKLTLSLGLIALALGATAQVKIKDGSVSSSTTPNSNAILELESNTKGLLYPRVALQATNLSAPLSTHIKGMVVYDTAFSPVGTPAATAVTPGIYYNDGTQWVRAVPANDWYKFQSTIPAANADSQYVMERVAIDTNSAARVASTTSGSTAAQQLAMLTVANGDANINGITVGVGGGGIFPYPSSGARNTAVGYLALYNKGTGDSSTVAVGNLALFSATTGIQNTAVGSAALAANTSGSSNIAVGNIALGSNITGNNNIAVGTAALYINNGTTNSTGNGNIALGNSAGINATGNYNIAIGTAPNFNLSFPNPAGNYQLNIGNVIYGTGVDNNVANAGNIGINVDVPNSSFQVNGSLSLPARTVSGAVSAGQNDYTLVFTAAGSVTLPAADASTVIFTGSTTHQSATNNVGRIYRIVNQTTASVTVSPVVPLTGGTATSVSVPSNGVILVQCVNTSTTTAAWMRIE